MNNEVIPALIINILFLILFLLFSAFFSGTEAAFFSLNNLEREHLRIRSKTRWKHFVEWIFSNTDLLLVTLLTGNTLVNVFATDFFATTVIDKILEILKIPPDQLIFSFLTLSEFLSIIIMTMLILIFGEMLPKNIAVRHPLAFSWFSLLPLFLIEKILKPFTLVLNILQTKIVNKLSGRIHTKDNAELNHELLSLTVQIGYKEKILDKFELDLFESYIEFRNKTASEVMIPRTELTGIDISTSIEELFQITAKRKIDDSYYIYVYNKNFDHLLGYINIRDLLPYKYGLKTGNSITELIKPFYSIPESKKLTTLSKEMRETNQEIAHVIDEYGGTAGIVTFQHLIQDVFEYFYVPDLDEIVFVNDGWYQVPGSVDLYRVEELLHVTFPGEMRTLSGMLIDYLGEIPEAGRNITIGNVEFRINKVLKNKIVLLEMKKR